MAASVLVHLVAVLALARMAGRTFAVSETTPFILLELGPSGREVAMPAYASPGQRGASQGGQGLRADELVGERLVPVAPTTPRDSVIPLRTDEIVMVVTRGPVRSDSGPAGAEGPLRTDRILGPAYGDGRLWVRPFFAALGVVGPSPDAATHTARVEAAVLERMKAFIDTMPRDSFALPPPPRWTTDLGGNTWGIDRNWIYLGDIKLPTALLALLPLPQGNYDQAKAAQELQRMREDIIQAARRAETAEEFRKYVEELRKRKDAEREAARAAQRDSVVP